MKAMVTRYHLIIEFGMDRLVADAAIIQMRMLGYRVSDHIGMGNITRLGYSVMVNCDNEADQDTAYTMLSQMYEHVGRFELRNPD